MRVEYWFVAVATLVYLTVDIYPSIKSFSAIAVTVSFWLLWTVFSVLNVIAWAAIRSVAYQRIRTLLADDTLAGLVIVILSTLCTLTILQSLTVKIAEYKFVDVGAVLENFRKSVLSDISERLAQITRLRQQRCADKLRKHYENDAQALRDAYADVMSFGGRTLQQIGAELAALTAAAAANDLSVERELASRIAKTDLPRARELTKAPL